MIFIGFSGYAGSGKDTICDAVAKELMDRNTHYVVKIPLAKKLKEICEECYDVPSTGSGPKDLMRRKIYQFYGKLGRSVYPNLWVDLVRLEAYKIAEEHNIDLADMIIFISDVRHMNELEFIHGLSGICFAVDADIRMGDTLTSDIYKHESEINIPTIRNLIRSLYPDRVLFNNTEDDQKDAINQAISVISRAANINYDEKEEEAWDPMAFAKFCSSVYGGRE